MSFGKRLSSLRKEKGLTQNNLADLLGVSRGTIGMYEIDKRDPDTSTLEKLSNIFNVSIDFLLGKTDNRNSYNSIKSNYTNSEQEKLADDLIKVLIDSGELKEGEVISEEKKERLLNMIKKAIEISKL